MAAHTNPSDLATDLQDVLLNALAATGHAVIGTPAQVDALAARGLATHLLVPGMGTMLTNAGKAAAQALRSQRHPAPAPASQPTGPQYTHVVIIGKLATKEDRTASTTWSSMNLHTSQAAMEAQLEQWGIPNIHRFPGGQGIAIDGATCYAWRPMQPGALREFVAEGEIYQVGPYQGVGGGYGVQRVNAAEQDVIVVRSTPDEAEHDARRDMASLRQALGG